MIYLILAFVSIPTAVLLYVLMTSREEIADILEKCDHCDEHGGIELSDGRRLCVECHEFIKAREAEKMKPGRLFEYCICRMPWVGGGCSTFKGEDK